MFVAQKSLLTVKIVPVCPISNVTLENKVALQRTVTQVSSKFSVECRWWQMGHDDIVLMLETIT